MDKSLAIGVVIGASLSGGFTRTVGSARSQFNSLGATIKDLSKGRDLIERFEKDQTELEKTRRRLSSTSREVLELKLALKKDPENAKLAKQLDRTTVKANKLSQAIERQRGKLKQSEAVLRSAGIDVKDLGGEYSRLGGTLDSTRTKFKRLGQLMGRRDAAKQRLSDLKAQALGFMGVAYAAGKFVNQAADFGRVETRLSTVISPVHMAQSLAKSRKHALAFAEHNLASETDILNIEYALNSAGLDQKTARIGSEIVSKVATVTNGAKEQVGEVMATVFNNLGKGLEGSTKDRLNRIGDLLTKAQFKFQIRDFGQLGDSMRYASPFLAQYNVDLAQGVTLIGELNSAGMQGTQAGTALGATFRNLSKASHEFGFDLAHDKNGGLDFIQTLQNMSDAIGGFDNQDQNTIDKMQKVFGAQGIQMISLLGPKLKQLAKDQREVADSSKGLVNQSYLRFLHDSRGQLTLLGNNLRIVGLTFGTILLPAVNAVLKPVTSFARWTGSLMQRFPILSELVTGAVVGLGLLEGGMLIAAAATWAWNAALAANPITWVALAVGGAAALIVHYWKPITGFFSSIWKGIKTIFAEGVKFLTEIWKYSPLGMLFTAGQKIAGWLGGGSKSSAPKTVFGAKEESTATAIPILGATRSIIRPVTTSPRVGFAGLGQTRRGTVPSPASTRISPVKPNYHPSPAAPRAAKQIHVDARVNAPIVIHAAPGQSTQDIAAEVDRKLREREAAARARQRGALYDD